MMGRVAFFAPAMRTVPLSGVPPVMRNLSTLRAPPFLLSLYRLSLSSAFLLAQSRHQLLPHRPDVAGPYGKH